MGPVILCGPPQTSSEAARSRVPCSLAMAGGSSGAAGGPAGAPCCSIGPPSQPPARAVRAARAARAARAGAARPRLSPRAAAPGAPPFRAPRGRGSPAQGSCERPPARGRGAGGARPVPSIRFGRTAGAAGYMHSEQVGFRWDGRGGKGNTPKRGGGAAGRYGPGPGRWRAAYGFGLVRAPWRAGAMAAHARRCRPVPGRSPHGDHGPATFCPVGRRLDRRLGPCPPQALSESRGGGERTGHFYRSGKARRHEFRAARRSC